MHNISTSVKTYNIPDEIIYNKCRSGTIKIFAKFQCHHGRKNSIQACAETRSCDKRAITLTLAETLSGDMLPFQMTYIGKTSHTLPTAKFSEGILLGFNKSHWSNEEETFSLVKEIISPYITKVKKKLKLPQNQVACLIWDAFKAQSTEKVKLELEHLNIKDVEVPKEYDAIASNFRLNNKQSCKEHEAT